MTRSEGGSSSGARSGLETMNRDEDEVAVARPSTGTAAIRDSGLESDPLP
jgi:hypothetical protein